MGEKNLRFFIVCLFLIMFLGFSSAENGNFSTENINTTINNKLSEIDTLKADINSYNTFEQTSINSALNISEIESELANLSLIYINATQEELDSINASLNSINIPEKIEITKTAISIPAFPNSENVDLDLIETVTDSSHEGNESSYKTAVIGWNINNLDTKISFNEFTASYGGASNEFLVSTFNLEITKKEVIDYSVYIFLEKMENLLFKQSYQEQDQGNYYSFDFTGNTKNLSFSTTESVNFTNLPFFISPAVTELDVVDFDYEEGEEDEKDLFGKKKRMIFILVIFLLLIFSLILYLVLQTWYKRRYEDYLFKNKNDLYNLANYITNSKRRGLDNSQIQERLKRSRWNSEQIKYALKKYSGRRTGMYEIALKKTLEKKEKGYQGYGTR